jgi:5-methylcytosine-specific restriction endonuclease McrA
MTARPCLGCGALIQGGSRCRRCEVTRRGTSAEQARYRREVLASTGGACARCGGTEKVEAHHLHPLADGGDKDGPGVALCSDCHDREHTGSKGPR